MTIRLRLVWLLLLGVTNAALAQSLTVRGKITDALNQGIPGANVLVKGTTRGTTANAAGDFTLNVNNNDVLVVSYLGYTTQEVAVNGRTQLTVTLADDNKTLNEVVVVGYGTQIADFFDRTSADYVGNLTNLVPAIGYHSYFTTSPYGDAVKKRQQLASTAAGQSNLGTWMSEYCILGDNAGDINGSGKDLGIDPAIYIAKVIHNDLVNANVSAWHWWIAISPYDYKDGLVYIDKAKTDGSFQPSKMLWALGNYSRFIRPGAIRVNADQTQNSAGLLVSAYKNTDGQLVTVVINAGNVAQSITPSASTSQPSKLTMYTTSATADLARSTVSKAGDAVTIPARSIVTLVGDLGK